MPEHTEAVDDQPDIVEEVDQDTEQHDEHDGTEAASTGLNADLRKARDQRDEARADLEQVRADLEAAQQQIEQVQTDRVDELITGRGYEPAAMWKLGLTLDDLRDDDGNIDPDLVTEQAEQIATEYSLAARRKGPPTRRPVEALTHGAPLDDRADMWRDALQGRRAHR